MLLAAPKETHRLKQMRDKDSINMPGKPGSNGIDETEVRNESDEGLEA